MNSNSFRLASGIIRNTVASQLFLQFGIDMARPLNVVAKVNSDCTSRCIMCHSWRTDEPSPFSWIYTSKKQVLSSITYKRLLKNLKRLQPSIKISFTGGEALLKDDIFDILSFCHEHNIIYSINTNGSILTVPVVAKLLALNPSVINISLDTLDQNIYEYVRGVPLLTNVLKNIDVLLARKKEMHCNTLIFIKTMICRDNLSDLTNMAIFAQKKGFNGITFQPIFKTTPEAHELFQIDSERLHNAVNALIKMKNKGYRILNSRSNMRGWIDYFNGNIHRTDKHCPVPLTNLYIFDNGDIKICEFDGEVLGNIEDNDIGNILKSEKVHQAKKRLVNCHKPCSYCIKRSFRDYVDTGLTLIRS